jgi:tRNA A-37 threonylcarbamoyl transferase component Bud32
MTTCPSNATLRLIGTEAIGETTFAGLEGHVDQCVDCQKILESAMNAVPQATHAVTVRNALPTLPGLVTERELGRGGASVVYLAWEVALKRHVAVKLFPRNSLVDPHMREHWLVEARALSRVPHDHVVAIHRVDETKEWLCLVIEYVSGGTLKDRLTEPLAPRDAARLTETIARAVGYFHTRGVCHLDLKPSNILIEGDPGAPWEIVSPKISDFGIARLEGEPGMTETGANGPKGTPSYMAPEQVAALPGTIGAAADIHALGALLYHLLTGRPPFQGASSSETLDQVRNQDPVPPRRLNGRIPRDLETICLKCLEKVPSRRYGSAEALAGDLHLWLEGRSITARRVSPLGHSWRLCRRHPAVAGLLLTVAVMLITGVVGLLVLLKQAEAERARLAVARRNAEAYAQFSATTADELAVFLRTALGHSMGAASVQMEKEALLKLRNATNDLKGKGIVPSSALGILELEIGCALMIRSKADEARDHLNQAVTDLKLGLAKKPEDKEARIWLLQSLFFSGVSAEDAGQVEDAMKCFEQAAAIQAELEPSDSSRPAPAILYKRLQRFADRLGKGDRKDLEKRARHTSQKILSYLLGSGAENSTDASRPGLETLGRLFQRHDLKKMASHEGNESRSEHERFVAGWLAISVEPLSPFRSSSTAAAYDQNPEFGAFALISAIRDRCSRLCLADSMVPATICVVVEDADEAASEQRNHGRLDDARATAERLVVLARRLVREYPNSAHSYRVLSTAHDHIKKNAFKANDHNLVEEALGHAVQAAQKSLALDPDLLETRRHLDKLTDQLANVKADRKASVSSLP